MSRLNKTIIEWIVTRNRENTLNMITKIMRRIISMEFPILFTKLYYSNNKQDKMLWNGKGDCLTLSWDCDLLEDIKAMPQILDGLS